MPAKKIPPHKMLVKEKQGEDQNEISLKTEEFSMTLIGHLEDLRKRLLKACLGWIIATLFSYHFSQEIINFLVHPLAQCIPYKIGRHLIYTDLSEAFLAHVKIACFSGIALAFPYIAAQLWLFIAPGLYKNEKKIFLSFLILSPLLFLGGMAMAYYGIFPFAWSFFLSFQDDFSSFSSLISSISSSLPLNLEPRVSSYLDLSLSLMIAFGICFQLPLILFLLSRFCFIQVHHLQQYRRHAIVGIFIVAAVMTPPDVFSQLLLALPLIGLYELSILLIRLFPSSSRS